MIVATFTVKLSVGFLGNCQMAGYELDLALMGMAVFLFINGSQLFAVDKMLVSNAGHKGTNRKAA
jgi:putative oxidoreductase